LPLDESSAAEVGPRQSARLGLKNTTKALIGLLAGKHRGKRMVKL
jgi:NADPH-dependent curcumin reductase CurA